MKPFKSISILISLLCLQTLSGLTQGFGPIDPRIVKLDTSSTCVKGEFELIITGPMTGDDGLPLGGYVVDSVQIKPWVNPADYSGYFAEENGVFGRTTLGQMVLVPFKDINLLKQVPFDWAFQNGKILILDGKNMQKPGGTPAMYSAIGFRMDGALEIFQTTYDPVTPYEMAEDLLQFYSTCKNVILLDNESGYGTLSSVIGSNGLHPGKMKLHFKGYAYGGGELLKTYLK